MFRRRGADGAARLFAGDATYQWGPFGDLLRGPDEIRAKWAAVGDEGEIDFRFRYEVLAVTADLGIARWIASADVPREGRRLHFDGVFALTLRDGLCTEFREWWNSSETPL